MKIYELPITPQKIKQIQWGLDLFKVFLFFAAKRSVISKDTEEQLTQEVVQLKKAVEKSPDQDYMYLFNKLIEKSNGELKKNGTIFPYFSFVTEAWRESSLLDQLDMVERTLTECARASLMSWEEESRFFGNLLKIFSRVEKRVLRPDEAIARLVHEMAIINTKLKEGWKLPVPELEAYK